MQAQHTALRGNIRRKPTRIESDDLEFSEYGRDPRFGAGWYFLPVIAIGTMSVLIASFIL